MYICIYVYMYIYIYIYIVTIWRTAVPCEPSSRSVEYDDRTRAYRQVTSHTWPAGTRVCSDGIHLCDEGRKEGILHPKTSH